MATAASAEESSNPLLPALKQRYSVINCTYRMLRNNKINLIITEQLACLDFLGDPGGRSTEPTKSVAPEPRVSSRCSQKPTTGSYPKPTESTPYSPPPANLPKTHREVPGTNLGTETSYPEVLRGLP
jgi:hypothetical protein